MGGWGCSLEDWHKGLGKHMKGNHGTLVSWVRGWLLGAARLKVLSFIPLLNQMSLSDLRTESALRLFDQLSSSRKKIYLMPMLDLLK